MLRSATKCVEATPTVTRAHKRIHSWLISYFHISKGLLYKPSSCSAKQYLYSNPARPGSGAVTVSLTATNSLVQLSHWPGRPLRGRHGSGSSQRCPCGRHLALHARLEAGTTTLCVLFTAPGKGRSSPSTLATDIPAPGSYKRA